MPKYDDQLDPRDSTGKRSHARAGAKETVRRVDWLNWLPVTWSGSAPKELAPPYLDACRTTRTRLIQRLKGKEPGLYCVELIDGSYGWPEIGKVLRVTSQLVSSAKSHLSKLSRTTDVADGEASRLQERLRNTSLALHVETGAQAVIGECVTLWLGLATDRPSRRASTEILTDALARTTDPGVRCALATALGQRRKPVLSRILTPWRELGLLMPEADLFVIHGAAKGDGKALGRVFGRARQNDRNRWWEAVLEHVIGRWPHRPMLAEFTIGFMAVLVAADHLRRLPTERLNRLLHCIGDAMRRTEAFTPLASGGYAWNHPFMAECRRVLHERLDLRLPPTVEAGLSGGIQEVCRWFLGMELRDIDLMRLKKIQTATDADPNFLFMKRLTDVFDRRLSVDTARQQTTLAGLCGAVAGANPETRLKEIAGWIIHCCDVCRPGEDGAGPLRLAARCLVNSYRMIDDSDAASRITAVAAEHGGDALRFLEHRLALTLRPATYENLAVPLTQTEDNHENVLLLLAKLPRRFEDAVPLLLTEHLTPWLSAITQNHADRLEPAIAFVSAVDDSWFHLPTPAKWTWVFAFKLESARLATRLTDWSLGLHDTHQIRWPEIDVALADVLRFLNEDGPEDREGFLLSHTDVLKAMTDRAVAAVDKELEDDFETAFGVRLPLLELTLRWDAHYGDGSAFANDVLARLERVDGSGLAEVPVARSGWETELAVLLSRGTVDRLITILHGASFGEAICDVNPVDAWRWLDQFPDVQNLMADCAQRNEWLPDVSTVLQRIDLGLRLQNGSRLKRDLTHWLTEDSEVDLGDAPIPQKHQNAFRRIARHRLACGDGPIPNSLLKIVQRPQSLTRELKALQGKVEGGEASDTAMLRVERLRNSLADDDGMAKQMNEALVSELAKQTTLAQLRHLKALALAAISDYWTKLCGTKTADVADPKWINVLTLYLGVTHNRRLLKELIRKVVAGEAETEADHPVNRSFLKEVASKGIAVDHWLSGPTESIATADGTWTIGIETDCLEIMRMGQIFGTCLRPGGDHSYAVVANAVEANKRVIVIRNEAGEVVGRKLIVVSRDGVVFGFRSYGRGAVCKAAADWYCRHHAERCGATLATPEQETALEPAHLELFATWYFDGTESFDPWLTAPDPQTFALQLMESQADVLENEDPSMLARLRWFVEHSRRGAKDETSD